MCFAPVIQPTEGVVSGPPGFSAGNKDALTLLFPQRSDFSFNPYNVNTLPPCNPYSVKKIDDVAPKTEPVYFPFPAVKSVNPKANKSSTTSTCDISLNIQTNDDDLKKIIEFGKEKKPTLVVPCKFFMKGHGKCRYGNHCRFSHVHFFPMPHSFSEDTHAQEYVSNARKNIQASNENVSEPVYNRKLDASTQARAVTMCDKDTQVNAVLRVPKSGLSAGQLLKKSLSSNASTFSQGTSSSSVCRIESQFINRELPADLNPRLANEVDVSALQSKFDWRAGDLVYREAVHYSSESTDSPTSKVCSQVLKILQESEEYQRIETICQREAQKHTRYFESMSPAFVDGSLIIMIRLKKGVQLETLPMSIPGCIDGVKTQITCGAS